MGLEVHVIHCAGPPTVPPTHYGQHWVDTTNGREYLSVGTATLSDWILVNQSDTVITANINAGNSTDLDVIPISSFCAVKYIVCVSSSAQNKWKSFELLGGKKTSTTVEDVVYSMLGSNLDIDFNFSVVGTDVKLIGTNNEAFALNIKIHKNGI